MFVYADHAATTKLSKAALQAMLPYLQEEYGNPSGLYFLGQRAAEGLERARGDIARCLGCRSEELFFTSGGSEADNQALISAAEIGRKKGKRHIISSAFEHHAVLHTLDKLKKRGFEITFLDVHENGIVSPAEVEEAIRPDTCLVTVMYANNEIGTVQPVGEIGAVCRKKGVLFHTDAVQAAGQLAIDTEAQKIDMLSLSAHKFHGPKGVGALYIRRGIPAVSLIYGGGQERGKRAGTENTAGIAGMAAALQEACSRMQYNSSRIRSIRDGLLQELLKIPHSVLNGDRVRRLPGNIHMCFVGIEGESLILLLSEKGICASSGSACTSGSLDPSHVLLAIGRDHGIAHGSLRLSLGADITPAEAEYIAQNVKAAVEYLRNMSPVWRDMKEGKKQHAV